MTASLLGVDRSLGRTLLSVFVGLGLLMSDRANYGTGYAAIRVDGPVDHPSRIPEYERDGAVLPTAGPSHVTVKEVVMTAEEARRKSCDSTA